MKEMETEKTDIDEKLASLKEEIEVADHTIIMLLTKERLATQELEETRSLSIEAMRKYGKKGFIHVKRMGEIQNEPWKKACQERYKESNSGWSIAFRTKIAEWEEKIQNPQFNPFKTRRVGVGDKWERTIDENNQDLLSLKEELGEEVMKTVVTALEEVEEYDPSGRSAKTIAWNYAENRRATLHEIMSVLIKAASDKKARKKRRL